MLQIFREIEKTGEELIVTDHNRPVLKIAPVKKKQTVNDIFANFQNNVTYLEDINTPTENEWELT